MFRHKKTIEYNGMTIEVKKKYGLFLLRAGNISLLSNTCNERDFAKLFSLSKKSLSSFLSSSRGEHIKLTKSFGERTRNVKQPDQSTIQKQNESN